MAADFARQRQQFQRALKLEIAGRGSLRNAGALRLLALAIILLLAKLDVGPKTAGLDGDVEAGFGILAQHAIGGGLGGVGGERSGVATFRIVRAADEGAELAGLQIELAGAAGRALPDIPSVSADGVDVRTQHVVEHVEHFGDADVLDLVDRPDEVAPEIPQHLLPGNLVVGDAVELLLEIGSEIIFDIALEEVFQERDYDAALVLAMQAPLLQLHIAAVLQHLQDRGIGRGPADAELFHALDQRGLREARRRL